MNGTIQTIVGNGIFSEALQHDACKVIGDIGILRIRGGPHGTPIVGLVDKQEVAIVLDHLPDPNQISDLNRFKEKTLFFWGRSASSGIGHDRQKWLRDSV